jgi:hypothetical protein
MKRDLKKAVIPFTDEAWRHVDLHALRETFCTNLSATGVYPRVAMGLMRQRDIRQTMRTNTDTSKLPMCRPSPAFQYCLYLNKQIHSSLG